MVVSFLANAYCRASVQDRALPDGRIARANRLIPAKGWAEMVCKVYKAGGKYVF